MTTIKKGKTGSGKALLPRCPLGLGGSWFVPYSEPGPEDEPLTDAISAAYDGGVRHFDTAGGYGGGHSEELYGAFLQDKRDSVFLASKSTPNEFTADSMLGQIEDSLRRLRTEHIDLYYLHWPKSGADLRPVLEGLQRAKLEGKIGAVGVSNFSAEQMALAQETGPIDAHQLGYNLLWRYAEEDLIPFCSDHDVAVITYSTIAHGILTGKFERHLDLHPADQRNNILPFRSDIWPNVHAGVEELKAIADEIGRPLMHLAIRWNLARPGIDAVLMGARNRQQAEANVTALEGEIPQVIFDHMTAISDRIVKHVPNEGNLFNHHP